MVPRQRVRVVVDLSLVPLLDRDRESLVYLGPFEGDDPLLDRFAHKCVPENQPSLLIREQPRNDCRDEMLRDLLFGNTARISEHPGVDRSDGE